MVNNIFDNTANVCFELLCDIECGGGFGTVCSDA